MPRRHRLERPFGRYLRAFERNFGAAVAGEVEPLHDCRVATRRLRELVPLVTAELGRKATRGVRPRLQQVGQALGTVREIDVAIELLEELTGDGQTPVDATVRVRQHLDDLRATAGRGMVCELERAHAAKLSRRLQRLVGDLRGSVTGAWSGTLARRMSARGTQLRDTVEAVGVLYVPDRLHAVRIAAKKLRYGFELAAEAGATQRRAPAKRLKAAQETLGRLHDIEVLTSLIQQAPLPQARSLRWVTHVDDFRYRLEAECRRLHSEFIDQRRHLSQAAAAAAETATRILSRPAGGRSTSAPLQMMLTDERPVSRRVGSDG
ncbi:MAG: CHAD domain-containing protein [Vicinamibacterales bacterium]|nr:CHAD domain-containing protein [Vicinamibacterales bacterium]